MKIKVINKLTLDMLTKTYTILAFLMLYSIFISDSLIDGLLSALFFINSMYLALYFDDIKDNNK